jgi:DNA-directed RNA polymerase specialized sigma24 family protein
MIGSGFDSVAMSEIVPSAGKDLLADPRLRADLLRFVRGRVAESEAEDVVQTILTDAFAARGRPEDPEELRRWVFGIAKNKVADVHRRGAREVVRDAPVGEEASAESAPLSARDLLRWAENELPEGEQAQSTLDWMLREGSGEKLEHIAEEERVPAARVRQRVSRLRKHYRARWAAQLAAAAALLALGLVLWAVWRGRTTPGPDDIARETPTPEQRAVELRRVALERCDEKDWKPCLEGLDKAKAIDPVGDTAERIREARAAAARALAPTPPAPSAEQKPNAPPEPPTKTAPMPTEAPKSAPPPLKEPPKVNEKAVPKGNGTSSELLFPQQQQQPAPVGKRKAPTKPGSNDWPSAK